MLVFLMILEYGFSLLETVLKALSIGLWVFPVFSNNGWLRFVCDELFWVGFRDNENTEFLDMCAFVDP